MLSDNLVDSMLERRCQTLCSSYIVYIWRESRLTPYGVTKLITCMLKPKYSDDMQRAQNALIYIEHCLVMRFSNFIVTQMISHVKHLGSLPISVEFVLWIFSFLCSVLLFIVCLSFLAIVCLSFLVIAMSDLLRFTASDYPLVSSNCS